MTTPNNGGPAFPGPQGLEGRNNYLQVDGPCGREWVLCNQGMSLRDYFAVAALPASQNMVADNTDAALLQLCKEFKVQRREQIAAHLAYRTADAMLAAREKGGQ
jgi:hypothetical protein